MTGRIEDTILKSLLFDEPFARKVLPFIEEAYFEAKSEQILFTAIRDFVGQYNALPTPEAIAITLAEVKGLAQDDFQAAKTRLGEYLANKDDKPNEEWLVAEVEKFAQDRAICNAVLGAMAIVIGENKELDKGAIPEMLTKALAVSLDPHIGHDYFEDADARFEYYHRTEQKLAFDLDWFNKTTNGGIPLGVGTLNVVMAGTHVGKTLIMCHAAASYLKQGKNVLYITLEISEEEVTKRIDANLLDIAMDDLNKPDKNPKKYFHDKLNALRASTNGRLIVKKYPTAGAHAGHFRHLLNELRLKKNFAPDIIFIDYLNICTSSRIKQGPNVNSYTYVKAIGEELRGLGDEFLIPVFSATQTNRCLKVGTMVETDSEDKRAEDLVVGSKVRSRNRYNTVTAVYPISRQKVYKIKTESGAEVVCSAQHLWPTSEGEQSIASGLVVGYCLEIPGDEEWLPLVGFESRYDVSSKGHIRAKPNSHFRRATAYLRPRADRFGYYEVNLWDGLQGNHKRVGTAVLEAFAGPRPQEGWEVQHKDGNKQNNHRDNLEWITPSANTQHAYDTGLAKGPQGAINGAAKINGDTVYEIRADLAMGLSQSIVAEKHNISRSAVGLIGRWGHI